MHGNSNIKYKNKRYTSEPILREKSLFLNRGKTLEYPNKTQHKHRLNFRSCWMRNQSFLSDVNIFFRKKLIQDVFLWCSWTLNSLWDVTEDILFLCDKIYMPKDM